MVLNQISPVKCIFTFSEKVKIFSDKIRKFSSLPQDHLGDFKFHFKGIILKSASQIEH